MGDFGEKCGVFGVYGRGLDVSRLTFFGLYALQHRGQESSGIAVGDGERVAAHRDMGLVPHVFDEESIQTLTGHVAIGHNRYSTSKGSGNDHTQPILVANDTVALAHNGNLPTTDKLESFLAEQGVDHSNLSDSAMVAEAIAVHVMSGTSLPEAVRAVYPLMTGAFSILVMDKDSLVAIRDPYGIRPLTLAALNGGYVFSSETCGLYPIGAESIREVEPGEMIVVDESGLHEEQLAPGEQKLDIFEFVYFARPDSTLLGKLVYDVRKNCGAQLAREHARDADMVVPVPETAVPVALGYAAASGIPYETGLIKNRYIHRTFIQPEQHIREQGVKVKLTPLEGAFTDKRVIVIDDSIVRGTTSKQIVAMLFEAGAAEVHFLVSSPPVRFPDFYGIDTPTQDQLLAATTSLEDMRRFLGATTLGFLSYPGLIEATGLPESLFCSSCFTGIYPLDIGARKNEITCRVDPALVYTDAPAHAK